MKRVSVRHTQVTPWWLEHAVAEWICSRQTQQRRSQYFQGTQRCSLVLKEEVLAGAFFCVSIWHLDYLDYLEFSQSSHAT